MEYQLIMNGAEKHCSKHTFDSFDHIDRRGQCKLANQGGAFADEPGQ